MVAPVTFSPPLLFGTRVVNASTSLGWGADSSTCQLTLVEDPADGYRLRLPKVGTAVAFQWGNFYFGGVFQRYTRKRSISGFTYDVILESPSKLMDGIQIILEGFQGTQWNLGGTGATFKDQISQVWNPYAVRENYSFGGIWGGADVNSAGFPAKDALTLIEEISKGEHDFGGPAFFGSSYYEIDLTEIKEELPANYRIKGPVQNLNAIIQECAEINVQDYFVTVIGDVSNPSVLSSTTPAPTTRPVVSSSSSTGDFDVIGEPDNPRKRAKIIVKTISRKAQPDSGVIERIVQEKFDSGVLIAADNGQELSNTPTQKLVIGGPASRYIEKSQSQLTPIWSKSPTNKYLLGNPLPFGYDNDAPAPILLDDGSVYQATVLEVRCAMSDRKTWDTFHTIKERGNPANAITNSMTQMTDNVISQMKRNMATPGLIQDSSATTATNQARFFNNQNVSAEPDKIFSAVQKAGSEFFGKQFLVALPYEEGGFSNNLRWIDEDKKYESSWDIADSAWTEYTPIRDVSFYDGEGKLTAVATWPISGNNDYSSLGSNYAKTTAGKIAGKLSVSKDILWLNFGYGTKPYATITCDQVMAYDTYTTSTNALTWLVLLMAKVSLTPKTYGMFGGDNAKLPLGPVPTPPEVVGIPQQSNRYSWGPWYKYAALNGKAEVQVEDSLRPETFGSASKMDDAAFTYANVGVSEMKADESGYVELAEVPQYNISDRMEGAGPYITNIDINIGVDGVKTTYKFNTWTPSFGKIAKYNIDRISRINKSSIAFLQDQRNRVTVRPLPSKSIGGAGGSTWSKPRVRDGYADRQSMQALAAFFMKVSKGNSAGAAVEPEINRPAVAASPLQSITGPIGNNFAGSAMSSWEQLISPISIDKEPKSNSITPGFRPPGQGHNDLDDTGIFGGTSTQIGPTNIDLNPYYTSFFDITSTDFEFVVNSDTNSTHEGGETDDLNLQKATIDIESVRSNNALRGPMLMCGWGYDIASMPAPADSSGQLFLENMTVNRANWKTGPVDLMWDDERQVWCGGLMMVEGILLEDLSKASSVTSPSYAKVRLHRSVNGLWTSMSSRKKLDGDGSDEETIILTNRDTSLEARASANTFILAVRINYEWRPLVVTCTDAVI